ncbi:hypothetical protein TEA_010490 [Camellia sinensis var. sinensis]|uniref:Uncharacterized protein n=1 Tax=Camellia sinensis var. sinensis TaxID=542762 RepID=A0A4S4D2U1_CAMSN|nr:hypothetical protein TEA_010490 [Camellia sinensis var. sinensis]
MGWLTELQRLAKGLPLSSGLDSCLMLHKQERRLREEEKLISEMINEMQTEGMINGEDNQEPTGPSRFVLRRSDISFVRFWRMELEGCILVQNLRGHPVLSGCHSSAPLRVWCHRQWVLKLGVFLAVGVALSSAAEVQQLGVFLCCSRGVEAWSFPGDGYGVFSTDVGMGRWELQQPRVGVVFSAGGGDLWVWCHRQWVLKLGVFLAVGVALSSAAELQQLGVFLCCSRGVEAWSFPGGGYGVFSTDVGMGRWELQQPRGSVS